MAVTASALSHLISFEAAHITSHQQVSGGGDELKLVKELGISAICIVGGAILCMLKKFPQLMTPGLLIIFFGAQTGMNMYMKAVFSSATVLNPAPAEYCADAGDSCAWMGFQASFFVTGIQQFGGFIIFWLLFLPAKALGFNKLGEKEIEIKKLTSKNEVIAVLCFAASFTMNIALNNMSMALIPLTLNLIIRSCLPLSTFLAQWLLTKYTTGEGKPCKAIEIGLMMLGAAMMCVCVWAKIAAEAEGESHKKAGAGESAKTVIGVIYCVVSLFSGSVNLALAGILKTSVKLDGFNTVVYNSIPAAIILLPFVFLLQHPVKHWDGVGYTNDAWVVGQVWEHSKSTFIFGASSALASLVYNILQFSIVQYLSATHVAFAGNFNKAATVPLALLVGIDHLPQAPYGFIMVVSAIINIISFAAYNVVSGGAGGHGGGGASKEAVKEKEPMKDAESSDDDDDDDEDSSEGGCC
ncbi:unnamed protein product [Prorocentrum cordatum]|uniref:Sugar phosphate transporter domain-containing protein n=1 Tax=Prorocentrum cordatum TaxID=2364126 RepID=A0ABN9TP81_9DINO|nr:unnamed protein product [Polarella glacialis]